jgi:hypothetical protein
VRVSNSNPSTLGRRLNLVSVVHLSPTPLVGAPSRLAAAQRAKGLRAECVVLADYPKNLAGKFVDGAILWFSGDVAVGLAERLISNAQIIHIHNDLPLDLAKRFLRMAPDAKWVYHVHSPLREGPLFTRRDLQLPFRFSAKLVVAQYQPRLYPDFLPVPNLVDALPNCAERAMGETLRVLFSPTHGRGGRWNDKGSAATLETLHSLSKAGSIELVIPQDPLSPGCLMALRRNTHVSIDEVMTGAFHLISLEGLCAGNVVLNGADFLCNMALMSSIGADESAPFRRVGQHDLRENLLELACDPELTATLQRTGKEYFERWLLPLRLVDRYLSIYERVLDADHVVA